MLKRVFRLARRARERLPRAVVALITLVAVAAGLTLFLASLEALRWYLERSIKTSLVETLRSSREAAPSEAIRRTVEALEAEGESLPQRLYRVVGGGGGEGSSAPPTAPEALTVSSFSDLFSSFAWLDEGKTTLAHDEAVTAFTFPPRFALENAVPPAAELRERGADGSDAVCLWNDCLVERGNTLSFTPFSARSAYAEERYRAPLPAAVAGEKISSVSIGGLETVWLVGVVIEKNGAYEGRVFTFDGAKFEDALDPMSAPFQSPYRGTLGFGGTDNDWIAIYGSYEGTAYHIRGSGAENVSRFFGIRAMEGGFQPVVLRAKSGWYVWSLTDGKPKLIKLFENGTGNVSGALDLTRAAFPVGARRGSLGQEGGGRLVLKIATAGGETEWKEFRDLGFSKDAPREIVSKNLNTYDAEVRRATIAEFEAAREGGVVELYLSNDGAAWVRAEVGREVEFRDPAGVKLFWKARIDPAGPDGYSPFLDRINIQMKVKPQ
ncbi:MAG: hypothetical protein HYU81_03205 [Candidatus Brennerbacteria bacterium]|nr:hypothetical protein [Candidatus Brennerbacteria bacterium]